MILVAILSGPKYIHFCNLCFYNGFCVMCEMYFTL